MSTFRVVSSLEDTIFGFPVFRKRLMFTAKLREMGQSNVVREKKCGDSPEKGKTDEQETVQ